MKKYVILKKINNTWYATRNRYMKYEVNAIADKLFDEDIDFEMVDDGDCYGLDEGVIVVLDDGRELKEGAIYLDDNLEKEKVQPKVELAHIITVTVIFWLLLLLIFPLKWALGILGATIIVMSLFGGKEYYFEPKKTNKLPDDHQTIGMMKGAKL